MGAIKLALSRNFLYEPFALYATCFIANMLYNKNRPFALKTENCMQMNYNLKFIFISVNIKQIICILIEQILKRAKRHILKLFIEQMISLVTKQIVNR